MVGMAMVGMAMVGMAMVGMVTIGMAMVGIAMVGMVMASAIKNTYILYPHAHTHTQLPEHVYVFNPLTKSFAAHTSVLK